MYVCEANFIAKKKCEIGLNIDMKALDVYSKRNIQDYLASPEKK